MRKDASNKSEKGLDILRYAKLLSCLLMIVCLLATCALADAADFSFTLNSAGTGYIVQKYVGKATQVVVPESYNGLPVTEIGEGAFENNSTITSVSLPSCVTRIGKRSFKNCAKLTSVTTYAASGSTIRIPGDVDNNGAVTIDDATLLMRYIAGETVTISTGNADVNGDAKLDTNDVLLLMQYHAGWGTKLQ